MRILRHEVLTMSVMCRKKKVSFFHEDLARATQYLRVVSFAKLRKKYPDRAGVHTLQGARYDVGTIAELPCCGSYALSRDMRDRPIWGVVENEGYGSRAQVEVFGQHL